MLKINSVSVSIMLSAAILAGCGQVSTPNIDNNTASTNNIINTAPDTGNTEIIIETGTYKVNPEQSRLEWRSRKLLVSTNNHVGTVKIKHGQVTTSSTEIISGNFIIDMITIANEDLTGASKNTLEKHLKSQDFFNVEEFPEASLNITNVTKNNNNYIVTGDLTIKGITNSITFPATVTMEENNIVAQANFSIDRSKWDIRFGSGSFFSDLGNNIIDDNIMFSIKAVANR